MSYSRDKQCSEHSRTVGASRNSCYLFYYFWLFWWVFLTDSSQRKDFAHCCSISIIQGVCTPTGFLHMETNSSWNRHHLIFHSLIISLLFNQFFLGGWGVFFLTSSPQLHHLHYCPHQTICRTAADSQPLHTRAGTSKAILSSYFWTYKTFVRETVKGNPPPGPKGMRQR